MEERESKASSSAMPEPVLEINDILTPEDPVPDEERNFPEHFVARSPIVHQIESDSECNNLEELPFVADQQRSAHSGSKAASPEEGGKQSVDTAEVIAKGVSSVLGPILKDFDAGVEGALKSQSVLASSIDRLTRELDKLLEDAPLPFVAQHAAKISVVRKRVLSINSTLHILQKRIDNIERMLSGTVHGPAAKDKHSLESSFASKPSSFTAYNLHQTHVSSANIDPSPVPTFSGSGTGMNSEVPVEGEGTQLTHFVDYNDGEVGAVEASSQAQTSSKDGVNPSDMNGFLPVPDDAHLETHDV